MNEKHLLQFKLHQFESPLGIMAVAENEVGITHLSFETAVELANKLKKQFSKKPHSLIFKSSSMIDALANQIDDFFNGTRKEFQLPLKPMGTVFQQKVWNELQKIPFGQTQTYLQQAKNAGNVKSIRASASANGKNPIALIIPCHRIIGSDGSLTGYAGGLWRKKWLLEHEAQYSGKSFQTQLDLSY
ncbi:MAG: methylated-DNA--[protein]-cysteine S-methyltransferase [Salinivirgaceae bacterium]